MKIGYGDRKVDAPQNGKQLCALLAQIMAAAINREIEHDDAKLALNAANRLVEAWQADTRMRIASRSIGKQVSADGGWTSIEEDQVQLIEQN